MRVHNDMLAVKLYVTRLQQRHVNAWKAYTFAKIEQDRLNSVALAHRAFRLKQ